jgi:hypothetical protein
MKPSLRHTVLRTTLGDYELKAVPSPGGKWGYAIAHEGRSLTLTPTGGSDHAFREAGWALTAARRVVMVELARRGGALCRD